MPTINGGACRYARTGGNYCNVDVYKYSRAGCQFDQCKCIRDLAVVLGTHPDLSLVLRGQSTTHSPWCLEHT